MYVSYFPAHIYIYIHLLRTRADADTHRHTFNEFPVHKQIIFIGWIPIVGSCFPTFPISKMFLHCVHGPSGTMIGQLSSLEDHPNLVGPLVIITHIHKHTHISYTHIIHIHTHLYICIYIYTYVYIVCHPFPLTATKQVSWTFRAPFTIGQRKTCF